MRIVYDYCMRGYHIFIGDIDLREAGMNYYDLPKEDRWLRDNSPHEIGGRSTDIEQIALSLEHRIRELYPINSVPNEIVAQIEILKSSCFEAEKAIAHFIVLVTESRVKKD